MNGNTIKAPMWSQDSTFRLNSGMAGPSLMSMNKKEATREVSEEELGCHILEFFFFIYLFPHI
ncbi:unnamed protein product [Musa acuminata subsp. malaccensis]|uniref:(wild Malaysian banana) hypothetical protein n=1 Tax=Musa acuminata subsp. malaccensis TaxID=214687 RepID=A0A8D7F3E8_MUSAM|nr:unnamed protein product [Musa acuminata subsp. malaccensis]